MSPLYTEIASKSEAENLAVNRATDVMVIELGAVSLSVEGGCSILAGDISGRNCRQGGKAVGLGGLAGPAAVLKALHKDVYWRPSGGQSRPASRFSSHPLGRGPVMQGAAVGELGRPPGLQSCQQPLKKMRALITDYKEALRGE